MIHKFRKTFPKEYKGMLNSFRMDYDGWYVFVTADEDPSVVKPSQVRVFLPRDDTCFWEQFGKKRWAAGKNSFSTRISIRRPTASSPEPSASDHVIPNSGNHAFAGYKLILHWLAEEGSPYSVRGHFYLVFRYLLLLLILFKQQLSQVSRNRSSLYKD